MSQLMDIALEQILQLSNEQKDSIAAIILAELKSDKRWENSFKQSQDLLADLADEALDEHGMGKSKLLNLDKL